MIVVDAPQGCGVCENRMVGEKEGIFYCALSVCPKDYPKRLENGTCVDEATYAYEMREKGILDYVGDMADAIAYFLLDIFDKLGSIRLL